MIKDYSVIVTQYVNVSIDDEKIDDNFNKNFSELFFDVNCIEDHVKHLAHLEANGLIDYDNFVEGYGNLKDFGCFIEVVNQSEEIEYVSDDNE